MVQLSTKYMGLKLKSPVIVGSSGLTNSIEHLKKISDSGAGAVVLKSIFEEQIKQETEKFIVSEDDKIKHWNNAYGNIMTSRSYDYEEAMNYISDYAKEHTLSDYLKFIEEAKKSISIPLIASINCVSQYDWQYFANRIQNAGADAIELNAYVLPSNFSLSSEENEKIYFDIIQEVKKYIKIPIALKVGYYFSSLASTIQKLSQTGISAMVLFNRPYNPDIDINKLEVTSNYLLSSENEYFHTLRWMSILSGKVGCDLSASTGIHSFEPVAKLLLAGASTVQLASVLYRQGFEVIPKILQNLETWMKSHNFNSVEEFRGKFSLTNLENPASFERVQFMKTYSKIE
jgi:dihydroorotate dehydrogenase (fumarate)